MTLLAIKYSVLLLFLLLTSCFYSEQGAENKNYLDVKYSSMIKMDVILSEDSTMLYSPSGLEFVRKGSNKKEVLRCNFANDSAKRYFENKIYTRARNAISREDIWIRLYTSSNMVNGNSKALMIDSVKALEDVDVVFFPIDNKVKEDCVTRVNERLSIYYHDIKIVNSDTLIRYFEEGHPELSSMKFSIHNTKAKQYFNDKIKGAKGEQVDIFYSKCTTGGDASIVDSVKLDRDKDLLIFR